jgi:type IV pilus secretin PilQ/predicted competence protein
MKMLRLFTAVIFTIFISSISIAADGDYRVSNKASPNTNSLISMDFQDANLKTVLKMFSQQSGLNFVASQNVQDRTVTIYFDNVSVQDALNYIMSANNLIYEQESGSNIFIVKESGKPVVETLTKIYELKYAQLIPPPTEEGESEKIAEIHSVIQDVLSKNGKVIADKRSNSLIITDVPSQFAVIEDVLARLDTKTLQVMIEAEILETTTTVADRLGVSWSGYFGAYSGPARYTLWPLTRKFRAETATSEGVSTPGSFSFAGNSAMSATLRALLSDTDTKVLARPKVLTLNNETARIELTAETAVASITTSSGEGAGAQSTTSAERINTGITLEVTPQINKDGYITMHIEPEVIVPVLSTYFKEGDATFVDPQKRSTKTTVMVRDGETIVIGGLISKEDSYVFNKVPFLGDIPLLGMAFRYKSTDESDKELLIFITPYIVKDDTYVLANISEREQERPKVAREKEVSTVLDLFSGDRDR